MPYTYTTQRYYVPDYKWDSWAQSIAPLVYDGYYYFQVNLISAIVCGIAKEGITESYTAIEFGFYFNDGKWSILEKAAPVIGVGGSFGSITVFKIQRAGSAIKYYVDDVLVHTSSTEAPVGDVYLYAAMYGYMDAIVDPDIVDEFFSYSATSDSVLPAFKGRAEEGDLTFSTSTLPGFLAIAEEAEVVYNETSLPAFRSEATTDDYCRSLNELHGISSLGEQGDITLYFLTAMSVLPGLTSAGMAEDPLEIDATLPAFESFGIGANAPEVINFAGSFSGLPPIWAESNIGMSSFLVVEIPNFSIQFFSYGNMIRTDNAFLLSGSAQATSVSREIKGEVFGFDGAMLGGASMDIRRPIFFLSGKIEANTEVQGIINSDLGLLSGTLSSGAQVAGQALILGGSVQGTSDFFGKLQYALFTLHGEMTGETERVAWISGSPVSLLGKLSAQQDTYGQIVGTPFSVRGSAESTSEFIGSIVDRPLFELSGDLDAMGSGGIINGSFKLLEGQLRASPDVVAQDVNMSYFWRRR